MAARGTVVRPGYIYITTCLLNGKRYIGQRRPQRGNDSWYIGSGILLTRAVKKYGKDVFVKEILEQGLFSDNELDRLERKYIQMFRADKSSRFYNIHSGGSIGCEVYRNIRYAPVYQYNQIGELLGTFEDAATAAHELGVSLDIVHRGCRTGGFSSKLKCFFTSDVRRIVHRKDSKIRGVNIFDMRGELAQSFQSVTECAAWLQTGTSHVSRSIASRGIVRGYRIQYAGEPLLSSPVILDKNNRYKREKKPLKVLQINATTSEQVLHAGTLKGIAASLNLNYKAFYNNVRKGSVNTVTGCRFFLVNSEEYGS